MEKKSVKISLTTIICIVIIIILVIAVGVYLIINNLSKVKDDGVNITNADKIINIIYNGPEEETQDNANSNTIINTVESNI